MLVVHRQHGQAAGASLRRALSYLRPYWRSWLLTLVGIGVSATARLAGPWLTREIIDRALPNRDLHVLVLCVTGIVFACGVIRLANVFRVNLTVRANQAILFDLPNDTYACLPLR